MRKLMFKGRLIKVYTFKNKDMVVHPGASVILPLLQRNKIILVKQYRFAINQWTWEVPAGTLNSKETPLSCAKRELEEETGFKAKKIRKLMAFYSSPGFLVERMHLYLATNLTKGTQNFDEDENIRVKAFTIPQIRKMIRKNKIVDAKTLVALFRYTKENPAL